MIEVKAGQIYRGFSTLIEFSKRELPVSVALQVADIVELARPKAMEIEKSRLEVFEKHGEKQENGDFKIANENLEEVNEILKGIADVDMMIPAVKIPIAKLGDIQISAEEAQALRWFLEV
jgi:hypothetical protein